MGKEPSLSHPPCVEVATFLFECSDAHRHGHVPMIWHEAGCPRLPAHIGTFFLSGKPELPSAPASYGTSVLFCPELWSSALPWRRCPVFSWGVSLMNQCISNSRPTPLWTDKAGTASPSQNLGNFPFSALFTQEWQN